MKFSTYYSFPSSAKVTYSRNSKCLIYSSSTGGQDACRVRCLMQSEQRAAYNLLMLQIIPDKNRFCVKHRFGTFFFFYCSGLYFDNFFFFFLCRCVLWGGFWKAWGHIEGSSMWPMPVQLKRRLIQAGTVPLLASFRLASLSWNNVKMIRTWNVKLCDCEPFTIMT